MPADETTLYHAHTSMSRNHPFLFVLAVVLAPAAIGLIILAVWSLRCHSTTLTVTSRRTILRTGILSKYTNEIRHEDVSNIQVRQTFFQRIFHVGYIGISSAAQDEIEIEAAGIPHPDKVAELINAAQ